MSFTTIRFSERSQQLWDANPNELRSDQQQDHAQLFEQVKLAGMVIDYTDRVIKGPNAPRAATLDEIEKAYVV